MKVLMSDDGYMRDYFMGVMGVNMGVDGIKWVKFKKYFGTI